MYLSLIGVKQSIRILLMPYKYLHRYFSSMICIDKIVIILEGKSGFVSTVPGSEIAPPPPPRIESCIYSSGVARCISSPKTTVIRPFAPVFFFLFMKIRSFIDNTTNVTKHLSALRLS